MERIVDENKETTSEEETEVPDTSTRSQHEEIGDATACSSRNGNVGVISGNDDSDRDDSFLSSRSQIGDYGNPHSCSTPLVARDADSSALSDIEDETLGFRALYLGKDPYLCQSQMSNLYPEETLSTVESPPEPGVVTSYLFRTPSSQLLPEAQLNLPLDDNNPPIFADCSNTGESTSSDSSSQLLPQTEDSNSIVFSEDRPRRRGRPRGSRVSDVRRIRDSASPLLPQARHRSSLVSGGQSRGHRPTSSKVCTARGHADPYSPLSPTRDSSSFVSGAQSRGHRPTSSKVCTARGHADPYSPLLPQTHGNSSLASENLSRGRRPTRSKGSGFRCRSYPSSPLLSQAQGSSSVVFSGGPSRHHRSTSTIANDVGSPCAIPNCRFIDEYNTPHNFDLHIFWDGGRGVYVCTWCNCGQSFRRLDQLYVHLRTHAFENGFNCLLGSCNRMYTNPTEFTRHVLLHLRERRYVCERCEATFQIRENLNAHRETHTSDSE